MTRDVWMPEILNLANDPAAAATLMHQARAAGITFLLVAGRLSGLLFIGPVLGRSLLPFSIRAALLVTLSLLAVPLIPAHSSALMSVRWHELIPMIVGELGFGCLSGLAVMLLLSVFHATAELIDKQPRPPAGRSRDSLPSLNLFVMTGIVVLLTAQPMNGHLIAVDGLLQSFRVVPPGQAALSEPGRLIAGLLHGTALLTISVAAPALAVLSLGSLLVAFLGRTNPRSSLMSSGLSIRTGLHLLVLTLALSGITERAADMIPRALESVLPPLETHHGP